MKPHYRWTPSGPKPIPAAGEEELHEALDRPSELLQVLPAGLISGMSTPSSSNVKQNEPDGGPNE